MQPSIRDAALRLGYVNAVPITGHPFDIWLDRVKGTHFERLSSLHDPAVATGWPVAEITLWVAFAPTPLVVDWPEGCGEMNGHYTSNALRKSRHSAWEDAVEALGFEVKRGAVFPDRAAAIRAGLGVHGLNGLLITPEHGSFVYITVLAVRNPPPGDARGPEHDLSPGCGGCGACIPACPRQSISEEGVDTKTCLRTYMNEPERMTEEIYRQMGRRVMGCDDCQRVCPYNAGIAKEPPPADLVAPMRLEALLTQPVVHEIIQYTHLNETILKTQAILAAANTGRKDLLPLIEALAQSDEAIIKKTAQWAVGELCTS
ncbi:MAG: 4Fe-4S dicluster domain-containing protein [Defluviitaleaceae bacterium]|nr:4Fe-4S dicluster domain-containing protein [Defluviitaleaceae bacterium]MCL2240095.1 4Fe-4S dicluster domain-containing protein [Defluviitaleaceae bacterium]